MAGSRKGSDPRSTEEILREMEELSRSIDATISEVSPAAAAKSAPPAAKRANAGALKSLLGFFVSVEPEEAATAGEADDAAAAPLPETPESGRGAATPGAATTAASSSARPAGPRVADLVAGEAHPTFDPAAAEPGADLSTVSFEQIYAEAGVEPATCSVEDLAKLMDNPTVASQPLSVKIIAVNLALSAKGVGIDVPIADAVRRDRALDAYQAMLAERATAAEKRNAAQIEQLTKEAEEYLRRKQAEMEELRAETAEANRQAVEFARRREAEEKRLAELISPFLEGKPSPVTVGGHPPQPGQK